MWIVVGLYLGLQLTGPQCKVQTVYWQMFIHAQTWTTTCSHMTHAARWESPAMRSTSPAVQTVGLCWNLWGSQRTQPVFCTGINQMEGLGREESSSLLSKRLWISRDDKSAVWVALCSAPLWCILFGRGTAEENNLRLMSHAARSLFLHSSIIDKIACHQS